MSDILGLEPLDMTLPIMEMESSLTTTHTTLASGAVDAAHVVLLDKDAHHDTMDDPGVQETGLVPCELIPSIPSVAPSMDCLDPPTQLSSTSQPHQESLESNLDGLLHYPDIINAVQLHQNETTELRQELNGLLDKESELLKSLNDVQQRIVDTEQDLKRKEDSLLLSVELLQGSVVELDKAREEAKKLMNPYLEYKDEGVEMYQEQKEVQDLPAVGMKRSASFSSDNARKRSREAQQDEEETDLVRSRRGSMSYLPGEGSNRRAHLASSFNANYPPYYQQGKSSPHAPSPTHTGLQNPRAYKPRSSSFSRPHLPLSSSKPPAEGKSSSTKPNYMPRFAEGDVGMLLEKIDQGVIPACLFDKSNASDIPFLEWSKTPPPSFLYVIAMFYEGKDGVERGISSFCKKQNIAKKGLVYLVQRIYEFCNPARFSTAGTVNPNALPKIRNAMEMLRRVVSKEETKWKRAKDHFGWTLRSLEGWPSYEWPSNAKSYFMELEQQKASSE